MQLIAHHAARVVSFARGPARSMVLAEPADRAGRLDASVAALPPHQLDRRTERRDVVQPPQSASVPGPRSPRSPGSRSRPGRSPPAAAARLGAFADRSRQVTSARARPAG